MRQENGQQKEKKMRAQSHRGRVETGKWTAKGKENESPEPQRLRQANGQQKEKKMRAQSHRGRVETGKWTAKGKENESPEPQRKG